MADTIRPDSARLNGFVQPNGLRTTVYFEYGRTTNYGMLTYSKEVGDGTTPVPVDCPVSALTSGAIHHFRCVATNSAGVYYGGDTLFLTDAVIRSYGMTTNGWFQVQFDAAAGTRYFLGQASALYPPPSWSAITSATAVADGPWQFTDRTARNFPMRFYRLKVREW